MCFAEDRTNHQERKAHGIGDPSDSHGRRKSYPHKQAAVIARTA